MRTALVTGGAGFIGSYVVHALVERGFTVSVIDDLSAGKRERLSDIEDKIKFYKASLFDRDVLGQAIDGCDTVFHLAAMVSVSESMRNPLSAHTTNVSGTVVVLEAARVAHVRRVVYSSSAAVYGDQPDLPKNEASLTVPQSPYALSKLLGEEYCRLYTKLYDVETVVLRYMNVFGLGQDPSGSYAAVIPIVVDRAVRNELVVISGDGTQTRDFVYVTDVAEANILAATVPAVSGETFVIATGVETSLNEMVKAIESALGRQISYSYGPVRAGDIHSSFGDAMRARVALGFTSQVTFGEGIRRILGL